MLRTLMRAEGWWDHHPNPPGPSPAPPSHNTTRTASPPPPGQSTQPSQSHRPTTSPHLPQPGYRGKHPRCPATEQKPPAPPSPPPCSTLYKPAGHPAGPWAGRRSRGRDTRPGPYCRPGTAPRSCRSAASKPGKLFRTGAGNQSASSGLRCCNRLYRPAGYPACPRAGLNVPQ